MLRWSLQIQYLTIVIVNRRIVGWKWVIKRCSKTRFLPYMFWNLRFWFNIIRILSKYFHETLKSNKPSFSKISFSAFDVPKSWFLGTFFYSVMYFRQYRELEAIIFISSGQKNVEKMTIIVSWGCFPNKIVYTTRCGVVVGYVACVIWFWFPSVFG